MIEGIKFIKAEEKYIYSYWQTFDKIAKERKYLAMDEAFPFEETVEFIKNIINKNLPQLFIIDLESDNCIGWCDVLPKTEKVGYLGMGILKEYREKGIGSSLLKQIIDLSKEYYLTDNVYLAFDIDSYSEKLYGYFYFKNDDYLYKNFNASHGDLNVWITGIIKSAVATCTRTTCDYLSDITNISCIRIYINLVTVDSSKRDYITECVNKAMDFAINKRNDSIYDKFEKTIKLLETVPDGYIVNSTILAELTEE